MPGTLAGKGSWVCRPYGETHHPAGDGTKAIEPVPGGSAEAGRRTARREHWSGPQLGQGVS